MINSAHRVATLVFLLSSTLFAAMAQEPEAAEAASFASYEIRSVDFEVRGNTIPFVLRQKIEEDGPFVGRSFPDLASLELFIEDRRTVLANNRVLESVESRYALTGEAGGSAEVAVVYSIIDTWNIMAFPMPDYSSDDGFKFYIKGKDYNFLGSMEPLTLNALYAYDENGNQSFEAYASFKYPFKAISLEWSLGLSEDLEIWFAEGSFASSTGVDLTLNLPNLGFPASVTMSQGFHYNEDEPAAVEPDPFFLSNGLRFDAAIPLGLEISSLGPISYGFSAGLDANYWPGDTLEIAERQGVSIKHKDSLSSGRVNWVGNMRTGSSIEASSSQTVYMDSGGLTWDLALEYSAFASFWNGRAGLAARVAALDRPTTRAGNPIDTIADRLRGIRGGRVQGVAALAANFGFPVKLFDFPTHSLIKKDWLDFELQAQPFADLAIVLPQTISLKPTKDWLWAAGGLELLVYPKRFRSVIVRAGAGWDLLSVLATKSLTASSPRDGASPYEIYFTTGLHF
jgi:hypothetical protein